MKNLENKNIFDQKIKALKTVQLGNLTKTNQNYNVRFLIRYVTPHVYCKITI